MLEKIFYESKPFLYLAIGGTTTHLEHMLSLGRFAAFLLVGCGVLVLLMRLSHRGYLS